MAGGGAAQAQDSVNAGVKVAEVGSVHPRLPYLHMPLLKVARESKFSASVSLHPGNMHMDGTLTVAYEM